MTAASSEPNAPATKAGAFVRPAPSPAARFRYAEREPAPALRRWISDCWSFEVLDGAPAEHVVPPDGCTSLVLGVSPHRPPVLLASGPWLQPLAVPVVPGERYHGLRIRAGAARELLGADPEDLRDRVQPAGRWIGPLAGALTAALVPVRDADGVARAIDAVLEPVAGALAPPDSLVARAVDRIVGSSGELRVATLAAELDVSPRTLLRRFRRSCGITPKEFIRVRRLIAAVLPLLEGPSFWGRLAAQGGYADQAHLHRDVVELTGITPGEFAQRVHAIVHDLPRGR